MTIEKNTLKNIGKDFLLNEVICSTINESNCAIYRL